MNPQLLGERSVFLFILFMAMILMACQGIDAQAGEVISSTVTSSASSTPVLATVVPGKTSPTAVPISTPTSLSTMPPMMTEQPGPTASPTADPYAPYTVETLAERPYGGGLLQIEETLEQTETFARYAITYPSDGLNISGFMNVPHQGSKFPVAILLHGYVPPGQYETLAYTTRYADALAEAGYFVIHPNLRNFPPSDEGPDLFRVGLAADVLNLIAIIREQSLDPLGPLRRADRDDIHLWGHSMGGGVALRAAVVNNEPYIKTAVLYGAMSGDERLNYEQIRQWSDGARGDFELAASQEQMEAISPIYHLERINAAISVHHGDADETVPLQWSLDLCRALEAAGHEPPCFVYEGAGHTFGWPWDDLFKERVRKFFAAN